MSKKSTYIVIISILVLTLVTYDFNQAKYIKKMTYFAIKSVNNTTSWDENFTKIEIESKFSTQRQPAYFFKSKGGDYRPLIISLHTWSGNYSEPDPLAKLCKENNINYIHPNFNGPNNHPNSCCSNVVIGQIDEAINYAKLNSNVDQQNIHIIGVSGGGYTAFCHYLLSKTKVKSYQSWVGISDLESWYYQGISQENSFFEDIMKCTKSKDTLNTVIAKKKSPLHMPTNEKKIKSTTLNIYSGIHDGIRGTVPITHSINFYNKIANELYQNEAFRKVSTQELLSLLEKRKELGNYGSISGRKIFFAKKNQNINLFIFDGEHEMLPKQAILSVLHKP